MGPDPAQTWPKRYLKNPSDLLDGPLHRAEVEQHGQEEADEVEDAERLEDEDRVEGVAPVDGLGDLKGQGRLVCDGPQVERRLVLAAEVPVQESGAGVGVFQENFNLKLGLKTHSLARLVMKVKKGNLIRSLDTFSMPFVGSGLSGVSTSFCLGLFLWR